jgi:hypothetical protein
MPAKSVAQQRLMAIAKHSPSKVYSKNKGVLGMSKESLGDFASTSLKGLPQKVKDGNNVLARIAGGKGGSILRGIASRRKVK